MLGDKTRFDLCGDIIILVPRYVPAFLRAILSQLKKEKLIAGIDLRDRFWR
jgi:hypothetical protein